MNKSEKEKVKAAIHLKILQISELQSICTKITDIEKTKQNDKELLKLLKKQYTLSEEDLTSIKSIVEGNKKGEGVDENSVELLKQKCDSYCLICDITTTNENGEFVGFQKLKAKCSNKKNVLSKKLKKLVEEEGEGE